MELFYLFLITLYFTSEQVEVFIFFLCTFIFYLRAGGAVVEDGAVLPVHRWTTSRSRVQLFRPEDVAESFEVPAEALNEIGAGDVGWEEGEETVLQCFFWRFSSIQRDGPFLWGYQRIIHVHAKHTPVETQECLHIRTSNTKILQLPSVVSLGAVAPSGYSGHRRS